MGTTLFLTNIIGYICIAQEKFVLMRLNSAILAFKKKTPLSKNPLSNAMKNGISYYKKTNSEYCWVKLDQKIKIIIRSFFNLTMISKTYYRKWLSAILFSLLILIGHFSSAQTVQDIFNAPTWDVNSLTGEELTNYGIIQSSYPDSNIIPIQIENLANSQSEGELLVTVDGEDCGTSLFKAKHTEYVSENDFFWYAELVPLDSCSCQYGYLLLRSQDGAKFGMLKTEETLYQIHDLTNGKNVLTKKIRTSENPDRCATDVGVPQVQDGPIISGRSGGNCHIRVLMLYTENLELDLVSIKDHASTEIDRLNMAFLNSAIFQNQAKAVLADYTSIDIDETDKKLTQVYNELSNQLEDDNSFAYEQRELAEADIVVLLVDYSLLIPESGVVGVGLPAAGAAEANGYFAIVAGNDHEGTFEHEVGHMLGGLMNRVTQLHLMKIIVARLLQHHPRREVNAVGRILPPHEAIIGNTRSVAAYSAEIKHVVGVL